MQLLTLLCVCSNSAIIDRPIIILYMFLLSLSTILRHQVIYYSVRLYMASRLPNTYNLSLFNLAQIIYDEPVWSESNLLRAILS